MQPSIPAPFDYSSQALPLLTHELKRERKPLVLDLGPAIGANIAFFSAYSCKLFVEDLTSGIAEDTETAFGHLIEKLEGYRGNTSFDLVLCWDLFNYLTAEQFDTLCTQLAPLLHERSMVYALFYSVRSMPKLPHRITLTGENRVSIARTVPEEIQVFGRGQQQLKKMLPRLDSKKSVLLRNGMVETLYEVLPE